MPQIGEPEFNWNATCLAGEYVIWIVCIDINFTVHKEKGDRITA